MDEIKRFDMLVEAALSGKSKRLAVALPEEPDTLAAVAKAAMKGMIEPILVGDRSKIAAVAASLGLESEIAHWRILDQPDEETAVREAVRLVSANEADMVMKGLVRTATFMKAILDKEIGLRTGRLLSHLAALELAGRAKLLFMTDGGVNIRPDIAQKVEIINNAVQAVRLLGIAQPKVAVVAGLELVNYKHMPITCDAAILAKLSDRGQIPDAIVDGPLAVDIAISRKSATCKGVTSPVAGDADILLMPSIECGNIFYKALVYFAQEVRAAGVVLGARQPIIMTSRADSEDTKFLSIAWGAFLATCCGY